MPEQKKDRTEFVPYAVVRAFQDALKEFVESQRGEMFADLVERYEADGSKSWDINLPGDDKKVASLSLSISKPDPKIVSKQEFTNWAMFNAPDLVKTVERPATSEVVAKTTALDTLLSDYDATFNEDGQLVTKDGEVVPGVAQLAERPTTFSLRWGTDGKRRVERAYMSGSLDDQLLDTPMPLLAPVEDAESVDDEDGDEA